MQKWSHPAPIVSKVKRNRPNNHTATSLPNHAQMSSPPMFVNNSHPRTLTTDHKSHTTPVSQADRSAEVTDLSSLSKPFTVVTCFQNMSHAILSAIMKNKSRIRLILFLKNMITIATICWKRMKYWSWSETPSDTSVVNMSQHLLKLLNLSNTLIRTMMDNFQGNNCKKHSSGPVKASTDSFHWLYFYLTITKHCLSWFFKSIKSYQAHQIKIQLRNFK